MRRNLEQQNSTRSTSPLPAIAITQHKRQQLDCAWLPLHSRYRTRRENVLPFCNLGLGANWHQSPTTPEKAHVARLTPIMMSDNAGRVQDHEKTMRNREIFRNRYQTRGNNYPGNCPAGKPHYEQFSKKVFVLMAELMMHPISSYP
jgi:hypothetical protein